MQNHADQLNERLRGIRSAFDESFALPAEVQGFEQVNILVTGTAQGCVGFRLAQISAIQRLDFVEPLPGQKLPLKGISAVQGQLVVVFDLAALLGANEPGAGKWMVIIGDEGQRIGLAFEILVGMRRVATEAIIRAGEGSPGDLVPEAVQDDTGLVQIMDIAAVQTRLKNTFGN